MHDGKPSICVPNSIFSKSPALRHVVLFLFGMKQPAKEPEIVQWSKKLGLRNMPLGIYEGAEGPPGYRLHADAEVTILLVKEGKVVHNFAYQAQGLTAAESKKILELVPALLK